MAANFSRALRAAALLIAFFGVQSASASGADGVLDDPRRGEAVDRICLTAELRDWTDLSENAVLVRRGPKEWYLLTLTGACRPDLSSVEISIASRSGSPCLKRNDAILTPRDAGYGQTCTVDGIYRWNVGE